MANEIRVKKQKSKGQKFKETHGMSLTMHKNMNKQGLDSSLPAHVETFRKNRKLWKNEIRIAQKAKADKAKTGKRPKSLTKPKIK